MEEESRRNLGRGVVKKDHKAESWRRNCEGEIIEEESWRRNHRGGIMEEES